VQAWVAELSAKRGPVIVQTAHSVLARILDDAVRDRLLASNLARGVKLPARAPRRNVYLTPAQLSRLADESGRYQSLVLLLGVGGLRWGEAAALRIGHIDFLRRRLELHRNAVQVGSAFVVGSLKSNKNRTVVLPSFVTDALAETAKGKGRDDVLWPSATAGYLGPPASSESWRMLKHASAAMTLDVYAALFDSDLDSVAESVFKMWSRQAK
jgi:integrase